MTIKSASSPADQRVPMTGDPYLNTFIPMAPNHPIIGDIEVLSVEGIRKAFSDGLYPDTLFRGEPLIHELTGGYMRGPRFKDCVRAFMDAGMTQQDTALLAVLTDDAESLLRHIKDDPSLVNTRRTLRCAFTPLETATLLHVCAEFNHMECAKVLVANGADINAPAGFDEQGLGGQTPVFHTVNQNLNASADMLEYLLLLGVRLDVVVRGLVWGKGCDWETVIPSVNPISYAMMGLLPMMHRPELTVARTVRTLMRHAYGIDLEYRNVPNKYLKG
jgi:hypothetical protein